MNFILKIVEGPNKGAEIALVEGVAVTLGKSDACDIVLADLTLPDESVALEATADGVIVGGERLAPLHVKTLGATSFAVGPSDAPWGALVWPEKGEARKSEEREAASETDGGDAAASDANPPAHEENDDAPPSEKKRHGGCFGCLVALLLIIIIVVCILWLFRDSPQVSKARTQFSMLLSESGGSAEADNTACPTQSETLSSVAARYGLSISETNGAVQVFGNFKTRRERLAATAEVYAVQPGVELDLSDDESLRTACEDALFTLTEGALKVSVATNRSVSLSGVTPSPFVLKRTLEALNGDLPKIRSVDVSGVKLDVRAKGVSATEEVANDVAEAPSVSRRSSRKASAAPALPVCGILTTPYPCLVMKNGARLLEGAAVGDSVILQIGADSVTLTNSTGKFTWKP